jgi:hypothetical protein
MKLEKTFDRHSSDKGLILRIYKQLKKLLKNQVLPLTNGEIILQTILRSASGINV